MNSDKPKRLLIISNMAHHYRDGILVGHGSTAREISQLPQLCDEVVHIGCLHEDAAPSSDLPYNSDRIRFIPLPPAGGSRWLDKLAILRRAPQYVSTILRELSKADYVHVRCPANIPLLALFVLMFARHPAPKHRWVKYAGNWKPHGREALSYTLQRWLLRSGLTRGQVTVNGEWPGEPAHVYTFFNPCLTDQECEEGARIADNKQLSSPMRLLFVGTLNKAKGVERLLEIMVQLRHSGLQAYLDVIGDGAARLGYLQSVTELGISGMVTFHGALPRTELGRFYANAHCLLLPTSSSEGWPKVISEGMAYGVVPIAGNVSSISQYLRRFGTGRVFAPDDISSFADAVLWYAQSPHAWAQEAQRGVLAAKYFTYSAYLDAVAHLFGLNDQ